MQPNNFAVKTWDALSTITTLDTGEPSDNENNQNTDTTHVVGTANLVNILKAQPTTPISLLVESLVQQLCTMLEQDSERANNLYRVICERLHKLHLIDASYGMSEFEVMRGQYQKALYQLVTVAKDVQGGVSSGGGFMWPLPGGSGPHNGVQYLMEWSRYYREFEEIDFIAGGGFGRVFKARHKLDGSEYAIKKICIKSSTINNIMTHLSEVKTLASLNHVNIVPYKAAWLEPLLGNAPENNEINEESDSEDVYSNSDNIINNFKSQLSIDNESSDFINFKDSRTGQNDSSITESSNINNVLEDKTSEHSETESNAVCTYDSQLGMESKAHLNLKWATLFIQMSLCQLTLRQWLDKRNKMGLTAFYNECQPHNTSFRVDVTAQSSSSMRQAMQCSTKYRSADCVTLSDTVSLCSFSKRYDLIVHAKSENGFNSQIKEASTCTSDLFTLNNTTTHSEPLPKSSTNVNPINLIHVNIVIEIMKQLTSGLNYIHSKGIVHHDLKPSNVFIGFENNLISVQLGDFGLACPLKSSHAGVGLGTPLYAAPEQLKGECNPKSDIYSLGVILLELLLIFSTDMERVKSITDFRKGQIPSELSLQYSPFVEFLQHIINPRTSSRPDTEELLRQLDVLKNSYSNIMYDKDGEITSLKNKMAEMNEQIKNKDEEIERLRNMISMMKK